MSKTSVLNGARRKEEADRLVLGFDLIIRTDAIEGENTAYTKLYENTNKLKKDQKRNFGFILVVTCVSYYLEEGKETGSVSPRFA